MPIKLPPIETPVNKPDPRIAELEKQNDELKMKIQELEDKLKEQESNKPDNPGHGGDSKADLVDADGKPWLMQKDESKEAFEKRIELRGAKRPFKWL
jgi:hypothetical protein